MIVLYLQEQGTFFSLIFRTVNCNNFIEGKVQTSNTQICNAKCLWPLYQKIKVNLNTALVAVLFKSSYKDFQSDFPVRWTQFNPSFLHRLQNCNSSTVQQTKVFSILL